MINVNDFHYANDNDAIDAAIRARHADGIVLLPRAIKAPNPSGTIGSLTAQSPCPRIPH